MKDITIKPDQTIISAMKKIEQTGERSLIVVTKAQKFLQEVVPTAYNALVAHLKYLETYNRTNNVPINNPENTQRDKADLRPLSSLFDF